MSVQTDEVVQWLGDQQEWLQEAALRLLNQGALTERDNSEILAILKTPTGSLGAPLRNFPSVVGSPSTASKEIRLHSIGPINGIDRLAPTTPLCFGEKPLVVVYGSNGAGKSGYVRILKKVSGKPNAQALKPNVFAVAPTERFCTFDYLVDGKKEKIKWNAAGDPLDDLLNLDIFDTPAARIYLENDSEATYTPPAVALFEDLVKAADRLRALLNEEKDKLTSKLPPIPEMYKDTRAAALYNKIAPSTTAVELNLIARWTVEDAAALGSLEIRLKTEDPAAKAISKRKAKIQIDGLRNALSSVADLFSTEKCAQRKQVKKEAAEKRKAAVEGAKATVSTSQLDGIGTDTWKVMWEAAREYSKLSAYPGETYPVTNDGSRCVLCHQELDEQARIRLGAFEGFVISTLETSAVQAEKKWSDSMKNLPVRPSAENLTTALQAAGLEVEVWLQKLDEVWTLLATALAKLTAGEFPEIDLSSTTALLFDLSTKGKALETEAVQMDADSKQFDRKAAQVEKTQMEAKKWTSEQSKAILEEHARQKTLAQYTTWSGLTSTTGISRRSTSIADKYLTQGYVNRFNAELDSLSAGHISVELVKLPTQPGKSRYKIQMKGLSAMGTGTNHVLSDGEQRIVSLAAFLADSGINSHTAPFIFDDPISSLDYDFEKACVRRLIELSKTRQVIIFTHRLSLVGLIVDSPEADSEEISIRTYNGVSGQPSAIKPYSGKPVQALSVLKQNHERDTKVFETNGYDAYAPLGRATCSEFRTIVEKSVEVILMDEIVLRFRKNVMTGDKKNNKLSRLLRIQHSDCDLIEEMMTRYSGFMHSNSDEIPVEIPPPDQIAADLDRMSVWFKNFKDRKIPERPVTAN